MSTKSPPICTVCRMNPCLWVKRHQGYVEWCSPKCRSKHPDVEQKRRNTCLERYGDITSARNSDVMNKKKQTCLERYGAVSPSCNEKVKQKQKRTLMNNYGVDSPHKSKVIRDKIKDTLQKRYGTSNFGEIKHVNNQVYEKSRKTLLYNWLPARLQFFDHIAKPLFSVDEFVDVKQMMSYECVSCGNQFKSTLINGSIPRCPLCYPPNSTTWKQNEVSDFISSLGVRFFLNERKVIPPYELDVYLPDHNLAIEFNGLYWHSDVGSRYRVDAGYHLNKTLRCADKNVQLLHVYEDEWECKSTIVKSMIKAKLGLLENRISARQCTIQHVPYPEYERFMNENHIQGSDKPSTRLGLYYKSALVACMSFCKPRFTKRYQYELSRYCTLVNTHVPGAASKLLSYFCDNNNPSSIVSYADRRFSTGAMYETLGFTLEKTNPPSYFYIDIKTGSTRRLNRISFQKHKLEKLLGDYDPLKTESQNMNDHGYAKVWDCGTMTFVKKF